MIKLIKPNISQAEIDAVSQVLATGRLVSDSIVERFEQKLANYVGVKYAVCVSSGTAALHLALQAIGINTGDEVLVPAFTFPATANVVEMIGARPVFIDCEPGGVNLDVNKLENRIGSATKAIMPVHAFGIPVDLDGIMNTARKFDIAVIEDSACALGSKYKFGCCGSFGDLAAFSFHPRKLLTTGEGGAVMTNNKIWASKVKSLRNHGYENGDYKYPGLNYRMTDFQAAMGVTQIEKYDAFLEERRQLAQKYQSMLKTIKWLEIIEAGQNTQSNIQTLIVKADLSIDRDLLIKHLLAEGIEATIGTYCVPLTHYYRLKYGYKADEFPHAYDAYKRCLSLPLYSGMKVEEINRVIEALKVFAEKEIEAVV